VRLTKTDRFDGRGQFAAIRQIPRPWALLTSIAALLLIFTLDRATGSAPFQHLYYLPIIFAGIRSGKRGGGAAAVAAIALYHLANPHLLGRPDLKVVEMGALINARMGLNTWAAFTGTNDKAAIAGDVAMLETELTPVLKALRKNGLDIVAIHHHMTNDRPMVIFLHYWGTGPAEKLASGFKAAVDELGKHGGSTSR
jgi:hypothetical protein